MDMHCTYVRKSYVSKVCGLHYFNCLQLYNCTYVDLRKFATLNYKASFLSINLITIFK